MADALVCPQLACCLSPTLKQTENSWRWGGTSSSPVAGCPSPGSGAAGRGSLGPRPPARHWPLTLLGLFCSHCFRQHPPTKTPAP